MKNNKGFTLIELIIVLVILTTIMLVAIPSVSSSVERRKEKDKEYRMNLLVTSAELYVDINRFKLIDKKNREGVNPKIDIKDIICAGLINQNQIINPYKPDELLNIVITYIPATDTTTESIDFSDGDDSTKISLKDNITC